ncbi:2-C-methyl-D-erythritol 4-phosphate cytidylyltransferase [Acinetobacter sp. ANC 3926]|uniref:2-C-methyl-D-erythritol 4-phosphate cytidylyltransferase n=1 Tax=Acinetobacter genomosp. 15BJ TaxID=106651 RepID=R9B031_9GAMM|nr:2-C-methyl-D-erythritol 4-phosphate cytidylyltransferase [Acinetobacter genomosp. 15BJ]EOR07762.1 2-C-methyl-D-erythritol 4-phosphate cytidylyltransferase [Acinetobacter genomosp. 15BJ]MCH7291292.1 2-C-methyl-D-erythritol 4-phosphate cytidylyltransferase [Acinetobacter genomosp. 15BJ]
MKTQIKLWAVVPAAGSGSRFSKTELKQYQYIQDQTVLEHTVNRLNTLDLAGCVLAIGAQDNFAETLAFQNNDKLHFCLGGAERVHSVLNALIYLSDIAHEDDWVLVHDAARPCVTKDCLTQLVQAAEQQNQSAILAIPVRDTLKQVAHQNQIEKTVSRELLWQAQTPQMAKLGILKSAIEKALANHIVITDEASALEYVKEPVQVVQGRSDNIKITYADDLELARLILQSQNLA